MWKGDKPVDIAQELLTIEIKLINLEGYGSGSPIPNEISNSCATDAHRIYMKSMTYF